MLDQCLVRSLGATDSTNDITVTGSSEWFMSGAAGDWKREKYSRRVLTYVAMRCDILGTGSVLPTFKKRISVIPTTAGSTVR